MILFAGGVFIFNLFDPSLLTLLYNALSSTHLFSSRKCTNLLRPSSLDRLQRQTAGGISTLEWSTRLPLKPNLVSPYNTVYSKLNLNLNPNRLLTAN